jgi:hypothetical protein
MSKVTLIGTRLAEVGREFVYRGESSACEGCPYRGQCLNLSTDTRYRVTEVRENAQTLECAVHDGGVRAVEVEPASVPANVDSKGAYAGSKATLEGDCPRPDARQVRAGRGVSGPAGSARRADAVSAFAAQSIVPTRSAA